jgi:hypothetical protein
MSDADGIVIDHPDGYVAPLRGLVQDDSAITETSSTLSAYWVSVASMSVPLEARSG